MALLSLYSIHDCSYANKRSQSKRNFFLQEKYFTQFFPFFMKVRIIRFGTKFKTAIKKLERKLSNYVIQLKG